VSPGAPVSPQTYAPRPMPPTPAPTRTSVRPEAASGLDGWLVDRLFGR
jgi:penicillin-binding protein 1A